MNCIKCPIVEECEAARVPISYEYIQEITITKEVVPIRKEDCPLMQAVDKLKSE